MVNVININILAHSVSPNGVLFAGVQGEDKATLLKVKIDGAILPTVDDGQTLRIFAEAVNGAGEYYVTEFLEIVDNVITFPIPLEITRGGGQATLNFVFSVLDENGKQVSAKYSSEIRLRFEDSVQFYQSEYLDTMASALAELYRYRALLADYGNSQEQLDELEEQIAKLEAELSGKVDKVTGMGLSKNDFNDDYKLTLDEFPQTIESILEQVENSKCDVSNLSDGSTAGSLRGINTKEEREEGDFFTPSYKMGESAVATGYNTAARGVYSHAEGGSTNANGRSSHAEGQDTTASGNYSHAEGISTTAGEGSHAEGSSSNASGSVSHAEGVLTTASGGISHAEGSGTTASGYISHAEGWITTASGEGSHAEGIHAIASGYISHAEGGSTIASGKFQHVQGLHNIEDTNNRYAHIVGNGEDGENRSNAHTLDWDGNAWFAGDVYVGGTSQDDENATKLSSVATDISQIKEKLDGIEEGANKTIVDSELSDTSTNPLQNKVVTEKINAVDTKVNNLKELKTPKEAATSTLYTAPYCQSDITVSDLTELKDYRTTIGAVYVSSNNGHSNIISVRHRNGAGDGAGYGMYIAAPLKTESDLKWRNQANGNWGTEKTLLDSSNFKTYIPYETGTCTLSASNGTVSNATYSVVGNMVTLNFNIALTGAGNVVVSGLPFTATKNQSGFASSTATYNITANQTSVSINSTSGTAEYCTITYLK